MTGGNGRIIPAPLAGRDYCQLSGSVLGSADRQSEPLETGAAGESSTLANAGHRLTRFFDLPGHAGERPQGGSLDLHGDTGQRAMRLAALEAEFAEAARPEDQGDRLYDWSGALLFDRDGEGDDRPEIDRSALRDILLASLASDTVRWGSRVTSIEPDGSDFLIAGKRFEMIVGADGAWSRVRPLLSEAEPGYEGVAFAELGFETAMHPDIAALTGRGKMFAVGENRALITQLNGHGHIRGYAGLRAPEAVAQHWASLESEPLRAALLKVFEGWAPPLLRVIETGTIIGPRPLYALPIGHRWTSRPGVTLIGDAAHLMWPFAGEGVDLALADAADLAEALASGGGWAAIAAHEAAMAARAAVAAERSAAGLRAVFSAAGSAPVLDHYRERLGADV